MTIIAFFYYNIIGEHCVKNIYTELEKGGGILLYKQASSLTIFYFEGSPSAPTTLPDWKCNIATKTKSMPLKIRFCLAFGKRLCLFQWHLGRANHIPCLACAPPLTPRNSD